MELLKVEGKRKSRRRWKNLERNVRRRIGDWGIWSMEEAMESAQDRERGEGEGGEAKLNDCNVIL